NDVYDVDATDEQVLADIQVDGQPRKVMVQANKNGFMYVLDRTNCKLIAAHPYVKVNWATHIDLQTGRPVLTDVQKRFAAGEEVGSAGHGVPDLGGNACDRRRTDLHRPIDGRVHRAGSGHRQNVVAVQDRLERQLDRNHVHAQR